MTRFKKIHFILLIYGFTIKANAAVFCPAINEVPNQQTHFLGDSQKMKEHQIQFAQSNMRLFCEKNMTLRYLRINRIVNSNQCLNKPLDELHSLVQNFEKLQSAWHLSLVPKLEIKQKAANRYYFMDEKFENINMYDHIQSEQLPDYFQTIKKNIDQLKINNKAADISAKSVARLLLEPKLR